MRKAVIFDLDGTLLDTLTDIMESVNQVLGSYGFPEHNLQAYKYFIGQGIEVLTRRAFPDSVQGDDFEKYLAEVKRVYSERQTLRTRPYEGVEDMLRQLNAMNISINILSNKPHEFAVPTVRHFFPDIRFDYVLGSRENVPRKPAPDAVFEILQGIGLTAAECLYVGDTVTDMLTAVAAGLDPVGVSWGFRTVDELQNAGAKWIIDHPKELIPLLNK